MGYIKYVTTDKPNSKNVDKLTDLFFKIEGMTLVYSDNAQHIVFQYKNYNIFFHLYTSNGADYHLFLDKTYNGLECIVNYGLQPPCPNSLSYVKTKNGITIFGLGSTGIALSAWCEDDKVYTLFSGSATVASVVHEVSSGVDKQLSRVVINNVTDPTNESRSVIVPYFWNTSYSELPLYSKILSKCLNSVVSALPEKSIISLNEQPYVKLFGDGWQELIPIDMEVIV